MLGSEYCAVILHYSLNFFSIFCWAGVMYFSVLCPYSLILYGDLAQEVSDKLSVGLTCIAEPCLSFWYCFCFGHSTHVPALLSADVSLSSFLILLLGFLGNYLA